MKVTKKSLTVTTIEIEDDDTAKDLHRVIGSHPQCGAKIDNPEPFVFEFTYEHEL